MIKIGLVEDNADFRFSLKEFLSLQNEIEVLFDAASVEDGLRKFKLSSEVNILLMDIGLPWMNGIEGIPHFKEISKELDIIMLSSFESEEKILPALCAGACSYISKKASLSDILQAVQTVHNGGSYMSPAIARNIVQYFVRGEVKDNPINLTERQIEIMDCLQDCLTYSQIAKKLFISKDTVRYHIKVLYGLLHANNKTEAIKNYMKMLK